MSVYGDNWAILCLSSNWSDLQEAFVAARYDSFQISRPEIQFAAEQEEGLAPGIPESAPRDVEEGIFELTNRCCFHGGTGLRCRATLSSSFVGWMVVGLLVAVQSVQ